MVFNSFPFLLLFAITVIIYYSVEEKLKKYLLLFSSAVFIGYAHLAFLIVSVILSSITFLIGKWIESKDDERTKSLIFRGGLILNILFLCSFKYIVFLQVNIGYILEAFGIEYIPLIGHVFLPLGISFYTFQAISYLVEIYWEEQKAEKDYASFMLYMLFFMKFISGPIERAEDFLPQIKKIKKFDYELARSGMYLIFIGLFKKMVVADRIAPYLNDVFTTVHNYSGAQILLVIIIYPIQLYADFSAYTDMAIGGARILGFELSPNFNRPFIAQTITDFWRRWHMSLSFWVRDYIYEPLAASRRAWKLWGVMYALFVTFILLGLWHGASWNFVIYGAIQGLVICYEMKTSKLRNSLNKKMPRLYPVFSVIRTYIIFSLSLLFFRIESFTDVIYVFTHMFDGIDTTFKELNLGINDHNIIVFCFSVVLMFLYEFFDAKYSLSNALFKQPKMLRWFVYYALAIIIILFGVFDSGDFIYLQF
jgi:D-alanyl-lipoteichoic acid acyltransferase DltB (MBOAT superfamily)